MKSINPRTGEAIAAGVSETSLDDVANMCAQAMSVSASFRSASRRSRARLLDEIGAQLEIARPELVALADAETALGETRLNGELTRTVVQLKAFAEVLRDGQYQEIVIDEQKETALGPQPDLRRMLVGIGPVGVFGASNFPFAFSVAGGDTAAALAAGCPVVVKAHSSHIRTAVATFEALRAAVEKAEFDSSITHLVCGHAAGSALVTDPRIKAVGFTGSESGGRALFNLASSRPEPIPFYAEMGSVNPAFVTAAAAEGRADEIAAAFLASITLGGGQFCTKPGVLFVPAAQAAQFRAALADGIKQAAHPWLLNKGIQTAFVEGTQLLAATTGVEPLVESQSQIEDEGFSVAPSLFWTNIDALFDERRLTVLEECFGPTALVIEYDSIATVLDAVASMPGSLSASVFGESAEAQDHDLVQLIDGLVDKVGRIVWNGFTTGVAVSPAMTHGGPYPASTSSLHTSVGATSIRRFLRPVTFQAFPQELLSEDLREGIVRQ